MKNYLLIAFTGFPLLIASCTKQVDSADTDHSDDTDTDTNDTDTDDDICTSDEDSPYVVEICDADKIYPGTTLFYETWNRKIVEIEPSGTIVWEYEIPDDIAAGPLGGGDLDLLDDGKMQLVVRNSGIWEIERSGNHQLVHPETKISHDADRLSNGNLIYVYGAGDTESDIQVKEVVPGGKTEWEWRAADYYADRFKDVDDEGWTHINGVQRLANGHTLVSLRNFYLTVILDENGDIAYEIDWSIYGADTDPHEPVMLPSGNILVCLQNNSPYQAVEWDPDLKDHVWTYSHATPMRTSRDCDRLPNGNTLIVGVKNNDTTPQDTDENKIDESMMIEVTEAGEVVWQMTLAGVSADKSPGRFYKALRIGDIYHND